MTPLNWAALAVSVIAIVSAFVGSIRWMVSHYLAELKPNGGSSLRDSVNRLEIQMELIIKMLTKQGK